ncbi:division/cell wall cluster transcriptional repressor MraZ [Croceimicrobium sp.]|uniref:division/cell wall cluster transcriptional repressor MraZ n=1 Tax=Croceimicrobium sp. TaxID=2828340 RepID=UPI003BACC5A0
MLNLIGVHECKMDAKGRVGIPSGLKKQLLPLLDQGFVLKRSVFQPCLELYPMQEWEGTMAKVNRLNRFVKKNNDFIRRFTAGVKLVEVDGSGRINVPNDLIAFSNLKSDIVLSASVGTIEIWDKAAYEATINDPEIDFGQLAEDVMGGLNEEADGLS